MEDLQSQIIKFLKEHTPPSLDSESEDYLFQLLNDKDSYHDPDILVQQLSQFWSQEDEEDDGNNSERSLDYLEKFVLDIATQMNSGIKNSAERSVFVAVVPNGDTIASETETETEAETENRDTNDDDPRVEFKRLQLSEETPESQSTSPIVNLSDSTQKYSKPQRKRRGKKSESLVCPSSLPEQQEDRQQQPGHFFLEDQASAWQECTEKGLSWGGRGKGGRGEYAGAVNSIKSNIHLSNVSICLDNGTELLHDTMMDVVRGHRYGLIGRNGVGKSTLLRRLAQKVIPGMPLDMRVLLVQQQIEGSDDSAINVLLSADFDREWLLREQQELEAQLQSTTTLEDDLGKIAERLGNIVAELDAIAADTAEERGIEILRGLQFTDDMIFGPTNNLSGGWRMRLALAAAIFVQSDLLLFDECTNHLDLYGLTWLINFLNKDTDRTLIIVSHDRTFLDAVCTDIIVMEHQRLQYHVGNFSQYEKQQQDKATREAQILDATERQRTKAMAFIQKQQASANKKSSDPNKQRQAKMIKEKKLERMGNYREDGKRYKLRSLKKLSEDHLRLAQKVVIEVDEPIIKMKFPEPVWPPSIGPGAALVKFEDVSFSYEKGTDHILNHMTFSLNRGSKVALVGRNGSGKSTLCRLIAGDNVCGIGVITGNIWVHPSIRVGYITQYSVEELETSSNQTVVEYIEAFLTDKGILSDILTQVSGNIRQYLGVFGLGGKHAHQKISSLSGGERMRLCFATVLSDKPQLLLMDESTNHVDFETLGSMSEALNDYQGSVLMVSHNQSFLNAFCNELWIVENGGQLSINHSDTESFDDMFSTYRSRINGRKTFNNIENIRQKSSRAAQASRQSANSQMSTALL